MSNKEEFDIEAAVDYMQKYWGTYKDQYNWEEYDREMFLNDALYGMGASMYPTRFRFAKGFERFKNFLGARFFKEDLEKAA